MRGDIAQGIKFLIGGSDFRSLADQRASALFEHAAKFGERKIHVEAGDGFKLVERAAGVAEPAPADHRHVDLRDLHWHAARPSLPAPAAATTGAITSDVLSPTPPVECLSTFRAGNAAEIEHFARVQHGFGERGGFGGCHAAPNHGHQPSGKLVVGNGAVRGAINEKVRSLRARFLLPIALLANDVDGAHRLCALASTQPARGLEQIL